MQHTVTVVQSTADNTTAMALAVSGVNSGRMWRRARMIYASDLRTLSPQNVIIKYADDTTVLVAQHGLVVIAQEYNNVCSLSTQNKLSINIQKTKEIIFHRPAVRNLIIPPPLPGLLSSPYVIGQTIIFSSCG